MRSGVGRVHSQGQRGLVGLLSNQACVEETRNGRLEVVLGQAAISTVDEAPCSAGRTHPASARVAVAGRRRTVSPFAGQSGLREADAMRSCIL